MGAGVRPRLDRHVLLERALDLNRGHDLLLRDVAVHHFLAVLVTAAADHVVGSVKGYAVVYCEVLIASEAATRWPLRQGRQRVAVIMHFMLLLLL